jgi:hypothetical protein
MEAENSRAANEDHFRCRVLKIGVRRGRKMNRAGEELVQLLQFAVLRRFEMLATGSEKGLEIQCFKQIPTVLSPSQDGECAEADFTADVFDDFCDD